MNEKDYTDLAVHLQYKCGKPTPLGVGWIAQKNKNNVYVDIDNIHIL